MKVSYFIPFLFLLASCGPSDTQTARYAKLYEDSIKAATEFEKEKKKTTYPAYVIVDNPTTDAIIYQVGNKKDTLPPFVYREIEIESGNNKLVVYDKNGHIETDTLFVTEPDEKFLLNIAHANYSVLMLQYKDFKFEDIKTPEQMLMDEILASANKDKKKQHEYADPNVVGDQHRAYQKQKFSRPSTTNKNYDITVYYMYTKIDKKELIVRKYWDFDPLVYFRGSESVKPQTHDSYLRQLIRGNELEIRQYLGTGESRTGGSGDWIGMILNLDYINDLVHSVQMVKSYDKKILNEIRQECKECADFLNRIEAVSVYTPSKKGLARLSMDNNEFLKKYELKTVWEKCSSKSLLIKKYFYKEHIEQLNQMSKQNLY